MLRHCEVHTKASLHVFNISGRSLGVLFCSPIRSRAKLPRYLGTAEVRVPGWSG